MRTVVECYKEAIRSYLEGTFTEEKKADWDTRLKTVFNRGFWNGYYLDNVWVNGARTMVRRLPNVRYMPDVVSNISRISG